MAKRESIVAAGVHTRVVNTRVMEIPESPSQLFRHTKCNHQLGLATGIPPCRIRNELQKSAVCETDTPGGGTFENYGNMESAVNASIEQTVSALRHRNGNLQSEFAHFCDQTVKQL